MWNGEANESREERIKSREDTEENKNEMSPMKIYEEIIESYKSLLRITCRELLRIEDNHNKRDPESRLKLRFIRSEEDIKTVRKFDLPEYLSESYYYLSKREMEMRRKISTMKPRVVIPRVTSGQVSGAHNRMAETSLRKEENMVSKSGSTNMVSKSGSTFKFANVKEKEQTRTVLIHGGEE